MGDTALELVRGVMTSRWLYAVLVGPAVLDAFLPLVPSETAVLLAGTFAAGHGPDLALVVLAGAAGAIVGDHVAYAVGRALWSRLLPRGDADDGGDRVPAALFSSYDTVAGLLWAGWCSGVGYAGGRVFADHPFVGAAAGAALALLVGLVAALAHRRSAAR